MHIVPHAVVKASFGLAMFLASLASSAEIVRFNYQSSDLVGLQKIGGGPVQQANYGGVRIFAEFSDGIQPGINYLHDASIWYATLGSRYLGGLSPGYEVGWIEVDQNLQVTDWSLGHVIEDSRSINGWLSSPVEDSVVYRYYLENIDGSKVLYGQRDGVSISSPGVWSVSVVPEPATYGLAFAGLLAVAGVMRRRA